VNLIFRIVLLPSFVVAEGCRVFAAPMSPA
jgi:hypothetical protein